jgi:hypothetical protein
MKIRQSFVANSSSSSFVIAFKNPTTAPNFDNLPDWAKKQIKKTATKLLGNSIADNIEELNVHFIERYGYCDTDTVESICSDPDYKEKYNTYVKTINDKYSIAFIEIDNNEDSDFYDYMSDKDRGDGMFKLEGDN